MIYIIILLLVLEFLTAYAVVWRHAQFEILKKEMDLLNKFDINQEVLDEVTRLTLENNRLSGELESRKEKRFTKKKL